MLEGVPQCGRVCRSVGSCAPVWKGMPQRERVSPLREGMPQCGKLCPSVGGCAPVWKV